MCQGDICRCHLGLTLSTHTSLVRSPQKCFQLIVLGRNRSILSLLEHSSARKAHKLGNSYEKWKYCTIDHLVLNKGWSHPVLSEHSCPWDLKLPECWAPRKAAPAGLHVMIPNCRGYREGLCHPCLPNPHKLIEDALTAGKCLLINQPSFFFPPQNLCLIPTSKV